MKVLLASLLLVVVSAQKKPLDTTLIDVFGTPPGLETAEVFDPYKQQLLEIYGEPPKNGQGEESDKQQLLEIYGTPPPETTPIIDSVKEQVLDIFGSAPTEKPIEEYMIPQDVYLNIFGDDEEENIEGIDNTTSKFGSAPVTSPISDNTTITSTVTALTSPCSGTSRPIITDVSSTADPLQKELEKVFGKPTGIEQIQVKPTESTATFVGQDGAPCQCVPYYLCDRDQNGVYINNASETGYGMLDIRFGEDDKPNAPKITRKCQETVELCCTVPKDPDTITEPTEDPKLKGCGYRNPKGIDITITGGSGSEAQYGEFPWVVALINAANGSLVGVGALIHPQVVITGAHVASKYSPGTLIARAGEWDTSTIKERLPFQEREIEEIYNHFDFHPKSLRNDVALLRLTQPFTLAKHINMICLPDQDESFDTSVGCIANGWGKDVFGLKGRYAVILKKVELNMVPYSRCSSRLKNTRLGPNFILHPSFVCAGGEEGKDTCTGDGGAPLTCPIGDDRYKLTGMVAWGIGCGKKDVPAVYAGVANFRTLIDDKMNEWGYGTSTYSI